MHAYATLTRFPLRNRIETASGKVTQWFGSTSSYMETIITYGKHTCLLEVTIILPDIGYTTAIAT